MRVKLSDSILQQWRDTDPERLWRCAQEQAQRLTEYQRECAELRTERDALRQQLQQAHQRVTVLEEQLAEAQRVAQRQAAPFRIAPEQRQPHPKRPGRPAGHPGAYRRRPEHVDEHLEVPLECCPHCGSTAFRDCQAVEQFIEEIPEVRPHVTHLITYGAICARCAQPVRSQHPLQTSTASGAAGVQLGPRALGLAAELRHAFGLTTRKTCRLLRTCFGLSLTPGGLVQAQHRVAGKLQPRYQALVAQLRQLPAVYVDETSWWVGGPKWWLWVFCSPTVTVYHVVAARDRAQVHALLGVDFAGVLVSDCLASYDDATVLQHKCYSHHLVAIRDACRTHPEQGAGYLASCRALLQGAMGLKAATAELPSAVVAQCRQALERQADTLLAEPRPEPAEERLRRRLSKQRDHLFTFLDHAAVDATNNLAERQLRPAVIARKLSCGNKTERGATTWQVLSSLATTCAQQAKSFAGLVAGAVGLKPP